MRTPLPNRRTGETIKFEHAGHSYYGTAGRYPDGGLGEVFFNTSKTGTLLSVLASDAAIACSLALQHGCPAETLRDAFLREKNGDPAGPLAALFDRIVGEGRVS